ncbi:hypothetical protein JEY40_37830 [Bradyrhizobium japonicum]|uniref:hypothetical protein n=1 Tax=Bradyrhizobium japonicum TaxID=375 RepID=UPI00200BFBAA|nr:hypothetical protein [Bradyrhizobium japonicum]UQD71545.1 hypothetical protein JEY40_37830 [Bradyrhizobium japonicum]
MGNRFLYTRANVAHEVLDDGSEARLGVLAVGRDKVLAEGDPLTSIAGLDVGRLRFVMEAVGEFVGVRVGFHRFEHGAVVTRSGLTDPDVTYFGEGEDRSVGPHLGFQGIVGARNWCAQAGGDCESSETAFH